MEPSLTALYQAFPDAKVSSHALKKPDRTEMPNEPHSSGAAV
jgi:hypothetical protein